jgi:glycosyltransferase involved in cell wall biosynthesis
LEYENVIFMKIGIDAKWYFEGPPSGKRVVRNLVDYLLKIDRENEYVIFFNKKHKKEIFPFKESKNLSLCYIWAGNNALSNIFVLPFFSNKYRVDVTLYQTFVSPFGKSSKIAYIHDVLFLSNPEFYTIYERLYFLPLRFLTRFSTTIITVSNEEKKRLLKYKYATNENKITVAYHGVEPAFMPLENHDAVSCDLVKKQYNLPDKFLLFVGRLNLRKNVNTLLKAIPLLNDKKIKLVIVGATDWKESDHEHLLKDLLIANRIHFTGAVYKELNVVYSMATVFCFPSYAESFGLPPLEAMASGIPVVVSNTTSLPEICGDAGNYVNPERPEEIAMAVDNLLSDDQLYRTKKLLGLNRAKKFTWDAAALIVLDCMKNSLTK